MIFKKDFIYHIYNQGNNRRNIFFCDENYHYFLKKIKQYILPYSDIMAWCLMPNHFHLMVYVNKITMPGQGVTPSILEKSSQGVTESHPLTKERTLNNSIAILLRSYTRAVNIQQGFSGSLFRKDTKAECVNCPGSSIPAWITIQGVTEIKIPNPEKEYPQVCFNYIHQNPVNAKLVLKPEDWDYSSAKYYAGQANDEFVNRERTEEFIFL